MNNFFEQSLEKTPTINGWLIIGVAMFIVVLFIRKIVKGL